MRRRQRAKAIATDNLRLAAYLGGPCSKRLLGRKAPSSPDSFSDWIQGLAAWGQEAEVRAGVVAGDLLKPLWERARPKDPSPNQTLARLKEWVENPSSESLERVGAARFDAYYTDTKATVAAGALTHLATALSCGKEPLSSCAVIASTILGESRLREAIAHSLAEWTLGYATPKQAKKPRAQKTEPRQTLQPSPGSAYCFPLGDGRYGACRVLQHDKDYGILVQACEWIGLETPEPNDPALRRVLRLTHHAHQGYVERLWSETSLPESFEYLGVIEPTQEERALECNSHGSWEGFPYQRLMQWRWDHEREAVFAEEEEEKRQDEREPPRRSRRPRRRTS